MVRVLLRQKKGAIKLSSQPKVFTSLLLAFSRTALSTRTNSKPHEKGREAHPHEPTPLRRPRVLGCNNGRGPIWNLTAQTQSISGAPSSLKLRNEPVLSRPRSGCGKLCFHPRPVTWRRYLSLPLAERTLL